MSMKINGSYNYYKEGYAKAPTEEKVKESLKEQDKNSNVNDAAAAPKKSDGAKRCTANTDEVDREIKKLKEKKQQLEQQIRMAAEDEEKVRDLEKELAQVESELSQKDNDAYRRQHASFSEWA